jgi:hypothetical protein
MNQYRNKTQDELLYIVKDAGEAARNMKGFDPVSEAKYLDQVNDAASELYRRSLENGICKECGQRVKGR